MASARQFGRGLHRIRSNDDRTSWTPHNFTAKVFMYIASTRHFGRGTSFRQLVLNTHFMTFLPRLSISMATARYLRRGQVYMFSPTSFRQRSNTCLMTLLCRLSILGEGRLTCLYRLRSGPTTIEYLHHNFTLRGQCLLIVPTSCWEQLTAASGDPI